MASRDRGESADQVERETRARTASTSASRVARDETQPQSSATTAAATELFAALSEPARPLLERPVAELGAEQQTGGHRRNGNVERRFGYRELGRVQPSCEVGGRGNQQCPAEHSSRDERDERDGADPDADLLEQVTAARHRNRHDGEKTRRAADAGRYARGSRV